LNTAAMDRFSEGMARHQAGDLAAAERCYLEVLGAEPDHPDALHLLGVIRQQQGDCEASIVLIERAIALRPAAHYFCNLANALTGTGRFQDAAAACARALALDPGLAMAQGNLGVALHALGQAEPAIAAFRAAIALDPQRHEAYANLGVVLIESGRRAEATEVLRAVLAMRPDHAEAWRALASAVAAPDDPPSLETALAHLDRAAALRPDHAETQTNRAEILRCLRRRDAAEAAFRTAVAMAPDNAQARYGLGLVLSEQQRPGEALAAFEAAARLQPDFALARSHAGNALAALDRAEEALAAHDAAMALAPADAGVRHNLGLTLARLGLYVEAAEAQAAAIALNPDYAEAHANLAGCQAELGQAKAALASSRRAIALKPTLAAGHGGLGLALLDFDRLGEAEAAFRQALRLEPSLSLGHANLGLALFRQGRLAEAEAAYRQAIAGRPDAWEAHHNLGVLLLETGRFEEGWREFEWRLRAPQDRRREAAFAAPMWAGEPLGGRTILVYAEQGFGDMIQCARFVRVLAALGARVVLRAPAPLHRLFAGLAGVGSLIGEDEPVPPADFRAPMFSLPRLLGVTLEVLPGPVPYLAADPGLTARWKASLDGVAPRPGPRIGVVWSGNAAAKVDRGRSAPLAAFEPLAQAAGAPLISLQKGFGLDQLTALPAQMAVTVLGSAYDAGDFADTAAVIENLDLVVACDTAVAHLAGALGRPVWLALNARSEWRWLHDRKGSPWYPGHRLYRQPSPGDWRGALEAMAADWRRG
jgi:tetratricopeptide (TPR) repeat protein